MDGTRKIALLISGSNFERQKNIIGAVHRALTSMGSYILYVFTNYGVFYDGMSYSHGEAGIYSLLEHEKFDGCIIEGNVGSGELTCLLAEKMRQLGTPVITVNIEAEGVPFLSMNSYTACCQMVDHLVDVHHCTKINLVLTHPEDAISKQALQAYCDVLAKRGLPLEEKRVIYRNVSIQNGRNLYRDYEEVGADDAEAFICVHDVMDIGLCLELQERGIRIPEDIKLCSLNYSTNSIAFRPSITGADRMDDEVGRRACVLLLDMMDGKEIERENYYTGGIHFGESCGCTSAEVQDSGEKYQQLILAKVEAGNQVSSMMKFNNALEEVDSLDQLGENIREMLLGIGCSGFYCCLSRDDLKFILNQEKDTKTADSKPYDDVMVALTGQSERTGKINNVAFSVEQLLPAGVRFGDTVIFLPIHYQDRDYGYMVFLNDFFPVELYNYRICHESIGSSLENLHRQLVLRSSIEELDELHMQDQLTGLKNRFALARFRENYTKKGDFTLVVMDMDGLKGINDNFGHLAGNHALNMIANVLKSVSEPEDLVIRYGGDEFVMLSYNTEEKHWNDLKIQINKKLEQKVRRQKLPYTLSVSFGYVICRKEAPVTLEECMERADQLMYEDKRMKRASR